MWYVYLLKSSIKKWYYVGSTNNLKRRIKEHNTRKVISTKYHIPLSLVFYRKFYSESNARCYERKIKGDRREKEKIIKEIEIKNNHCGIV